MRNWNWIVIVAAGGLAFACGSDDDSKSSTSGAGGSGGSSTVGNTSRTTGSTDSTSSTGSPTTTGNTSDTSSNTSDTSDTSSTTGTGGTTSDTSSTTGAGGAAGETSTDGMGGEGGMGEGGMAGSPPMLTPQEEQCQAACDNQALANCADWTEEGCMASCLSPLDFLPSTGCEDEFADAQACDANTPPGSYDCFGGSALTTVCDDENDAMFGCTG